jgi:hypothetical protein
LSLGSRTLNADLYYNQLLNKYKNGKRILQKG